MAMRQVPWKTYGSIFLIHPVRLRRLPGWRAGRSVAMSKLCIPVYLPPFFTIKYLCQPSREVRRQVIGGVDSKPAVGPKTTMGDDAMASYAWLRRTLRSRTYSSCRD